MQSTNVEAWTSTVEADIYLNGQVVSKRMDLLLGSSLGACKGKMHTAYMLRTCWHHARSLCVRPSVAYTVSTHVSTHSCIYESASQDQDLPMISTHCRPPSLPYRLSVAITPHAPTNPLCKHSVIHSPAHPLTDVLLVRVGSCHFLYLADVDN